MNEIDKYISSFPEDTQKKLDQMRAIILKAAPGSEECISYKMPAYKLHGMLAWFAGYKNHLGLYPGASGIAEFKKDIRKYKWAKGSVQFPLDKPLPGRLIEKMIRFKVKENSEKYKAKKK